PQGARCLTSPPTPSPLRRLRGTSSPKRGAERTRRRPARERGGPPEWVGGRRILGISYIADLTARKDLPLSLSALLAARRGGRGVRPGPTSLGTLFCQTATIERHSGSNELKDLGHALPFATSTGQTAELGLLVVLWGLSIALVYWDLRRRFLPRAE